MNRIKICRIMASIVGILFLLAGLLPQFSASLFGFSESIMLYELIFKGVMPSYIIIAGVIALAAAMGTAIFGFIFSVHKNVTGILSIIGAAFALFLEIYMAIDNSDSFLSLDVGIGLIICILLAASMLILGILILVFKEKGKDVDHGGCVLPKLPKAMIVGISGMYQGASFDVSDGKPVTFGRDPAVCNIVFDQFEAMISRVHCIVAFDGMNNSYRLRDISKNGVFIGNINNRVSPGADQTLRRGTVICLGSANNVFKLD